MVRVSIAFTLLCASACYSGVQSTTSIAKEELGPEGADELSYRAQNIELTGAFMYQKFEFFAGVGLGEQSIQKRSTASDGTGSIVGERGSGSRYHLGLALRLHRSPSLDYKVFGAYAFQGGELFGIVEDDETSRIERSMEFGLQVGKELRSGKMFHLEPFMRLGLALQDVKANPSIYSDAEGSSEFATTAFFLTIGANVGMRNLFDD